MNEMCALNFMFYIGYFYLVSLFWFYIKSIKMVD
jgi:hypothetical protein